MTYSNANFGSDERQQIGAASGIVAGKRANSEAALQGSSASIAVQFERLKRELEETHAATEHLLGRISPILGPSGPSRPETGANRVSPAMSPIADMLDSLAYSVQGLRARIVDAIERTEL